jgi:hypothetical protein
MIGATDLAELDPELAEAARFQRDLYLYWAGALEMGAIPLTTRGLVTRPALRRLVASLDAGATALTHEDMSDAPEQERPRTLFLRRALERLHLLRLAGEADARRLEPAETRLMARYLDHALAERVAGLARLWASGGWWPDHPQSGELPGLQLDATPRLARARRRALTLIASTAPGAAIELAETPPALERLGQSTRRQKPLKVASRRQARQAQMAQLAGGDETLMAALAGPLAWLGLAHWDEARGVWVAGLLAQALRPAGAASANDAMGLAEAHGRVVAQSDLTLIAYPPFTAPTLFTLDLLAVRESLNQTARYRLGRQAFARARMLGWDAAQAVARLERLTGTELPAPACAALADWERSASRLRLTEDAILLETPSAQTLDALLADRVGAAWVLRRLTPTAALLYSESAAQARAWLLRRGHLPAMIEVAQSRE